LALLIFSKSPSRMRFYSRPCGRRLRSRSKASGRTQQYRNPPRGVIQPRARCPQGIGGWTCQQADCLRPRHQPPNDRELPGQSHDQDAGWKPLRSCAHGFDRWDFLIQVRTRPTHRDGRESRGNRSGAGIRGAPLAITLLFGFSFYSSNGRHPQDDSGSLVKSGGALMRDLITGPCPLPVTP
jgi:hypothetical protein